MCLKSHDAQQCTVQCALAKRIDLRPSDFRISGFRNAAPDQKFGIRFVGPFRRASNSRSLARLGGARAQAALLSILNFKLEQRLILKAITARPAAAHQLAVLPVAEGAGHVLASTADHGGKVVLADLLTDEEIIAQAKTVGDAPGDHCGGTSEGQQS